MVVIIVILLMMEIHIHSDTASLDRYANIGRFILSAT